MSLYQRVIRFIHDPTADDFGALALAIFAHQFENVPAYRKVCQRRGMAPDNVGDWRAIPPVPTLAFKHARLCAGEPQRTFITTGTTQGLERRGQHPMPHLQLYEACAVGGMKEFLFPDVARIRILSLIHSAQERPDSSLAQMVEWALTSFGADGGGVFVTGSDLRFAELVAALRQSERDGEIVCLLSTTAALIRFLDQARERDQAFRLPHGSRLMDTGGSKGTPRPLSRNGLLRAVWDMLAIPGYFAVNEYGMTELSSQFYDNVIRERHAGRFGRRVKAGSHWVRTRVLDPVTLVEVPFGESGVLCHTDLGNAGSALVVLTEDIGHQTEGGFEIDGRVHGAEARGCSLALADFLA